MLLEFDDDSQYDWKEAGIESYANPEVLKKDLLETMAIDYATIRVVITITKLEN